MIKKEYYKNDKLIYEGNRIDGKMSGQGKMYDINGLLIYDGNWVNGKMSGQGKMYDINGKLIYDGSWVNGKRSSQGKMYDINGKLLYEGDFVDGKMSGQGKMYDENGKQIYDGNCVNSKGSGQGKMLQKSPDDLRRFAIEVAQKTRKPFDDILLRKTITNTKEYIQDEKYPVKCWILEKYTDTEVDHNQYFTITTDCYVLKTNGDLNVITVKSKEIHYDGYKTFYQDSSAEINDMTFLALSNLKTPIVQVNLLSLLLYSRSAYMLDVARHNWITYLNEVNGDYILRDYPYTLRSEGADNGSGEYQYSQGEGLYVRLKSLMTY